MAKCGLDVWKKCKQRAAWDTVRYAVNGVTWGSDDPAARILIGVHPVELEFTVS
jgi:hypothetical protein